MSFETLVLDKIEEKGHVTSRKRVEEVSRDAVDLKEDTTPPSDRRPRWGLVRHRSTFAEGVGDEEAPEALQIIFDESPPARSIPMRASLDVLSTLRSDANAVNWLEAATILKRDVVRLRGSSYSRHAAVLLALADALTFTGPEEVSPTKGTKAAFSHALGLLSEPYISEASEEEFLGGMLMAGWNLTPSEEQAVELVD